MPRLFLSLSADEARKQERGKRLANRGAVTGTGLKWRGAGWLRKPRNIAVKRILAAFGLRGEKLPPSSWEDLPKSCERNWKRFRKTRWRE